MKKTITIVIIVLVAVGFGYWLFKISPTDQSSAQYTVDTSAVKQISTVPAFDPSIDRYQGDPKAKNVFIEYADYQCPACAAYSDILKQVPSQFNNTVFVYRYFPLVQIHKNAVIAALAAEAAGAQGKYWEMHDILFPKQGDWENMSNPLDTFAQYAQQAGVPNIDQFKSDVTSQKYKSVIEKNNNEALGLKLQGTPTFFFNGHQLQNTDLAGLKQQAEQYMVK
jgi:protein-disulfide isomerase